MELEDLKKSWGELNARLENHTDMPGAVFAVRERTVDFRRRTERTMRIPMIMALILPLLIINASVQMEWTPGIACTVLMIMLSATAVADYTMMHIRLRRLDPLLDSVSETSRKIRTLRRQVLYTEAVKVAIVIPLILSIADGFRHSPWAEYAMRGFWIGFAIGLPVGISIFVRIYTDIIDMERLFSDI